MINLNISINGTTQPIKKLVVEFYENGEVKLTESGDQVCRSKMGELQPFNEVVKPMGDSRMNSFTPTESVVTETELPPLDIPDTSDREASISSTMNEDF